jgi:TatD DNase family protein
MGQPVISLDAHAHLNPASSSDNLRQAGAVLAGTLSLTEAQSALTRREPNIVWGIGCHPRKLKALEEFDPIRFSELIQQTHLVSEVGLDGGAAAPIERQLQVFHSILESLQDLPRLVSIHSYRATKLVLDELEKRPLQYPILHWWTGNVIETCRAVELGCCFSIHSAIARHSKFRLHVPLDRILVESDHGWSDPPAAIPYRIRWVEYLVAAQYRMDVNKVRELAWHNLLRLTNQLGIASLFPVEFIKSKQAG